jgi:hypothetical protein
MNSEPADWSPGPELLAAYFDGELAGRPDLAGVRRRIADWLRCHPEARAVLDDYRRLAQLWRDTSPADPGPGPWQELDTKLALVPLARPGRSRRQWLARWTAALVGVAAAATIAIWLGLGERDAPQRVQTAQEQPVPARAAPAVEVFAVATAAEVTILRVEGADTQTVVVGELPLHGPMELLGPGEMALTSIQPDARDRMMPHVRIGGSHRPMIWAPVNAEAMEP